MSAYAPKTITLATNVILDSAVRTARARLAGTSDPAAAYDDNARTFLVALSAVELIEAAA